MYDSCIPFTPSFEGCAALGTPRLAHSIPSQHCCPEPREVRRVFMRLPVTLPALSFQSLPTVKSCNHFVLITIQNAGGWACPLSYHHPSFSLSAVNWRLLSYLSS